MITLVTEVSCEDETIRDYWTPKRVQSRVNGLDNGSDSSGGREKSAVGMLLKKQQHLPVSSTEVGEGGKSQAEHCLSQQNNSTRSSNGGNTRKRS